MNLLFLGSFFPQNLKAEIITNSKEGIEYAAHTLQLNYVMGLDANMDKPIKIINAPIVGSFPLLFKSVFVNGAYFSHTPMAQDISVRYCNIAILKNLFIQRALYKELVKEMNSKNDFPKVIIVYSMLSPWVKAAVKIKMKYPKIKLCLIIPDLPEYMSNSNGIIYKIRNVMQPDLYKYIPYFDSYVFLTSQMANHFSIKNKPWVVIEGMINKQELRLTNNQKKSGKKVILYSGTLAERYGILNLLKAFTMILDPEYELWICGNGSTRKIIENYVTKDSRIKYWGQIEREQVLVLQKKATVLINPREPSGEYTNYSFPSKIMEYMLSGTPSIMYALPGIPHEYYKYIYIIEGNGAEYISKKIVEVCEKPYIELKEMGDQAQNFVLSNKNNVIQTKKLISMLNNL